MLLRAGYYKKEDQELIFVTVHDAVLTALMDIVTEVSPSSPEKSRCRPYCLLIFLNFDF